MANFLYVDNSNIWIEGMHVSAVQRGMSPSLYVAQQERICDSSWRMDFGRLFEFAGGDREDVGRAVLYGSRPPDEDSIWNMARRRGFEVIVFDKNVAGKEKKVDTKIATDMIEDSFLRMKQERDEITLVSGDSDFVPTAEALLARGFPVHVVFWNHAANELKQVATKFHSLDAHLDFLNLNRNQAG